MLWSELVDTIAAAFPESPHESAQTLVSDLVDQGVLVSALRPPSTCTDPIGHVLGHLDSFQTGDGNSQRPVLLRSRAAHGEAGAARPAELRALAAQMRGLARADQPLAVDLRLPDRVTLPEQVAADIVVATEILRRLTPDPTGRPQWRAYRARFVDRYGTAAVVPLAEVVDPVTGLGFPTHFHSPTDQAVPLVSARDERLLALAQQASIDGVREVVLDDAAVLALAGSDHLGHRVSSHVDVSAEIRAVSLGDLSAGRYTVAVTGMGRSALATSGRFLDLLPSVDQERMSREFAALPVAVEGAMPAQVSFPPHNLHSQNVLRARQVLPWLISLGEYRPPAVNAIDLDDLGVAAGCDRLVLVSMSRRRVVEPTVAHAAAVHTMPLIARLLVELPRATDARLVPFAWGTATCLPFLPALRYGRVLLAAARWLVDPAVLPNVKVADAEWSAAFDALRHRLGLPGWVQVGHGDQRLRLNLDHAMDRALLRAHLHNSPAAVTITEAAGRDDFGWLSGRAHEIVLPVASTAAPVPAPAAVIARSTWPPPMPAQPIMPGSCGLVSASLACDPATMDTVLIRGVPALLAEWVEPPSWWIVRLRHPVPHLRLRLHTDDYGDTARKLGRWAAVLRQQGLVGDLTLDTYQPESGRYGDEPALTAAHELFAADSRAALAQLSTTVDRRVDRQALTAVSMVDLASAMLGSCDSGYEWLVAEREQPGLPPMDRAVLRQVINLHRGAVPPPVRQAWQERAAAAARYADALAASGGAVSADSVLASLLHLHHIRVFGPTGPAEQSTHRLARQVALAASRSRRAAEAAFG
ncbi:thiopeptide-type bacteriocin biosynthesis domain-containing protein [Asanoa hainanensis]|uniref:Thiopeptide-type bacteriocin biosynthesis domain-containing protein n=2 Tax=Asanoa hainanensis TaxID=560556 RepID=A0A239PG37_9ACTN|nr:thiopeptide-type bacteriocin biosynthesis domain-containing protein [Asanoa hainanensis]